MNQVLLYLYNIYSRLLYKIFTKIKINSLQLKIMDNSISFPMVSSEKLLFWNIKGRKILDLGTGCGIIALFAKKRGAKYVLGTDINPRAIANAQYNLKTAFKDQENIEFKQSDLFENVDGKFDIIVFHAPYFDQKPASLYEYKSCGENIVEKVLHQGRKYLSDNGEIRILLPESEATNIKKLALKYKYKLRIKNHKMEKNIHLILIRILFRLIYHPKLNVYVLT